MGRRFGKRILTFQGVKTHPTYWAAALLASSSSEDLGWVVLDISGGLDPQRNPKYFIVNNATRTRGKTSVGIVVFSDEAVVVNNAISYKRELRLFP